MGGEKEGVTERNKTQHCARPRCRAWSAAGSAPSSLFEFKDEAGIHSQHQNQGQTDATALKALFFFPLLPQGQSDAADNQAAALSPLETAAIIAVFLASKICLLLPHSSPGCLTCFGFFF